MTQLTNEAVWPELPYAAWQDTYATLHCGPRSSARSASRGRRGSTIPGTCALCHARAASPPRRSRLRGRDLPIEFDFIDHVLWLRATDGASARLCCAPETGRRILRRGDGGARRARRHGRASTRCRTKSPKRSVQQDRAHAAYDRRFRQPAFSRAGGRSRVQAIPHRLSRQSEPGAFLLGQFRSRGDALFRAARAAAHPGGVPELADAVAREAYSHEVSQRRLLARRRRDRLSGVLFLRLSGAGRFRRGQGRPDAAFYFKDSASSSCPTTRCARRPIRRRRCWNSCKAPTRRRRIWPNGIAKRWNVRWARRGR